MDCDVSVQNREKTLFDTGLVCQVRPDIVISHGDKTIVLDTKWKAIGSNEMSSLLTPRTVEYKAVELKVTSIANKAFYGCKSLTYAELGEVSHVGMKAFARCSNLKTVESSSSLRTVSAYAFWGCSDLERFTMLNTDMTLRILGSYSFYNCGSLADIVIPEELQTMGREVFSQSFVDENGDELEITAESLCGYNYSNVDGVFVRQAR